MGSIFTNKVRRRLSGTRYYGGCEYADKVEQLASIAQKNYSAAEHANVQAHSGTSANVAVYMSTLQKDDVVLGMNLRTAAPDARHPLKFLRPMYNSSLTV